MRLLCFQLEMKLLLFFLSLSLFCIGSSEAKQAEMIESSITSPVELSQGLDSIPSETSPIKIHSNILSILRGRSAPFTESGSKKSSEELKWQKTNVMANYEGKDSSESPAELPKAGGSRPKPFRFIFQEWSKGIRPQGSLDHASSATAHKASEEQNPETKAVIPSDFIKKKYAAWKKSLRSHQPTDAPPQESEEQNEDGEYVTPVMGEHDSTKGCEERTTNQAIKDTPTLVYIIGYIVTAGVLLPIIVFLICNGCPEEKVTYPNTISDSGRR